MLIAFGLRLYSIDGQSLWYDEALSVTYGRLPFSEILETHTRQLNTQPHPPLHCLLLHGWFRLFGFGALQARLLSAFVGTLSVGVLFLLGNRLFGARAAVLASLLLGVSQLGLHYSQEVRPYALVLFFTLCATYLFVVAVQDRSALAWWGFALSAVLLLLTHYYGVFVVGTLFLYAALNRRRLGLSWRWLVGGALLVVVAYSPWVVVVCVQRYSSGQKELLREWPSYAKARWTTPFATLNRFSNGGIDGPFTPPPLYTYAASALLFILPAGLAMRAAARRATAEPSDQVRRTGLALVVLLWAVPFVVAVGLGFLKFPFDIRYVSHCIAPYYLLVGYGITQVRSRRWQFLLTGAVLVYSAWALRGHYVTPYKEDYRGALAEVANGYQSGDRCVFLPFGGIPLQWSIYHGDGPQLATANLDDITSGRLHPGRVWLVMYRRIPWASEQCKEGQRQIEETYRKIAASQYFWVDVALYVPNSPPA
jgi:uncharacterized membrane protein